MARIFIAKNSELDLRIDNLEELYPYREKVSPVHPQIEVLVELAVERAGQAVDVVPYAELEVAALCEVACAPLVDQMQLLACEYKVSHLIGLISNNKKLKYII